MVRRKALSQNTQVRNTTERYARSPPEIRTPNLTNTCSSTSATTFKHHAMKTYGGVEARLHASLTSAHDGGKLRTYRANTNDELGRILN